MAGAIRVNLEVPEGISDAARENACRQAREGAVLALWQGGEFSTRDAAEELGLGYVEFLDLLASRGISIERRLPDLEAIKEAERKLTGGKP